MEAFDKLREIAKEVDNVGAREDQAFLVITADIDTGEAQATFSDNISHISNILMAFFRENPELYLEVQENITTIGLYSKVEVLDK